MPNQFADGIYVDSTAIEIPVVLRLAANNTEITGVVVGNVTAAYTRSGGTATTFVPATWVEASAGNARGLYRMSVPDVAFDPGADWVMISAFTTASHVYYQFFPLTTDVRQTGDAFARLGAPVGASTSADIAAVKAETVTILADTDNIQTRIPATLVGGTRMDCSVGAMAADVVTAAAIAAGAIDAGTFAAGAIDSAAIGAGAITSAKIAAGAITSGTFALNAIDAAAIADNAIDAGAIAANAITSSKIAAGAIGASQLAANAIGSSQLAAGAIGAATFAAGAIDAAAIASNAITAAKIATDAIGGAQIASTAVTEIMQPIREGTAAAVAAGTITLDASASAVDDYYNDQIIQIISATTGAAQARYIVDYVGATKVATIAPNWITTPTGTIVFAIWPQKAPRIAAVGDEVLNRQESAITTAGSIGVKLKNASPLRMTRATAFADFRFVLYSSTDHVTIKTGLGAGVTASRLRTGDAAYAATTNAVSEIGATGTYTINLSATDLTGDSILFKFSGAGADDMYVYVVTEPAAA